MDIKKTPLHAVLEAKKRKDIPDEDLAFIDRILDRMNSRAEIFKGLGNINQGFLKIERVVAPDGCKLFGQNAPSFAHNRLILYRGIDGSDGKEPADILFSALISEESLAQIMLSTNRSSDKITMTGETMLGDRLAPFEDVMAFQSRTSGADHVKNLKNQISEGAEKRLNASKAALDMSQSLSGPPTKTALTEMRNLLQSSMRDLDDSFTLDRHSENMERELVQHKVEAATAALNYGNIVKASQTLLEDHRQSSSVTPENLDEARHRNPMINACMMNFSADECEKMLPWIDEFISRYLSRFSDTPYPFDSGENDDRTFTTWSYSIKSHEDRDQAKKIKGLLSTRSTFKNSHQKESRKSASPWMLTVESGYRNGGTENLHASFPTQRDGYFSFRVYSAEEDISFGNTGYHPLVNILDIGLSIEDFMTALRGHPEGKAIPCSIDRFCGEDMPRQTMIDPYEIDLDAYEGNPELKVVLEEFMATSRNANTLIDAGLKKVADRKVFVQTLSRMVELHEYLEELRAEEILEKAGVMSGVVSRMLSKTMDEINQFILENHDEHTPLGISMD